MPRAPRAKRIRGQGSPDWTKRKPLPLTAHAAGEATLAARLPPGASVKVWRLGECGVILTVFNGVRHLSVSHPDRYPTWDEIAEARYRLCPNVPYMAIWLPPTDRYINIHRNCFQLIESEPTAYVRDHA